jgi:hypothetical protein
MKKYFLIFMAATALVSCDVRRKDKIVDDASKQMLDALKDSTTVQLIDSVYNFGKITEGEQVAYSFRFKNTGKKPLVITNASASCGCTVPEKPEKPIKQGEVGFIKVVFNSKGKSNHQEKVITVSANVQPFFPELKLIGEVLPPTP